MGNLNIPIWPLHSTGWYPSTASLYCRALAIREKVYGQQHSKTIDTREHLHTVLQTLGKMEEAAALEIAQLDQAK